MHPDTVQHLACPVAAPASRIVVHNGALGDFVCAWPALHAIALHHRTTSPEAPLFFYGNSEREEWLEKIGYLHCPPAIRRTIDGLYAGIPAPEFAPHNILWFCLHTPPIGAFPHVTPLPALTDAPATHVTQALLNALDVIGIAMDDGWRRTWWDIIGRWYGGDSRVVAFIPGAGHTLKQWPLSRFGEVADELAAEGWQPVWVAGPAEYERGMMPPAGYPVVMPTSCRALVDLLCRARLVIGNDCGPMHLAAMSDVPTLTLFGPVDHRRWAPSAGTILRADVPCAACTLTTQDMNCPHTTGEDIPACLDALAPHTVLQVALKLLATYIG